VQLFLLQGTVRQVPEHTDLPDLQTHQPDRAAASGAQSRRATTFEETADERQAARNVDADVGGMSAVVGDA
jgi:hypothetical protein